MRLYDPFSILRNMRTAIYRTCANCLRGQRQRLSRSVASQSPLKSFTASSPVGQSQETAQHGADNGNSSDGDAAEVGAMSRRLSEMTDETIESGNRSTRKAVEEAGFSEDLKRQLEERLSGASPRSQNQQAFSEVDMPVSTLLIPRMQRLTSSVFCRRRHPFHRRSPTLDRFGISPRLRPTHAR